jgi:hypothetical protein
MRLRSYQGVTLAVILAFVSPLLLTEGAARIYANFFLHYPNLHKYDKILGWKLRPSISAYRKTRAFSYNINTDVHGLRSEHIDLDRKPDTYRLLILGDSFAFGEGLEVQNRFDHQLKTLHFPGKTLEVVNAGVMGYGTDQELLYFSQNGLRFRPNLVILMTYENDLEDIMLDFNNTRYKPKYVLKEDNLLLTGVPVPFRSQIRDYSYVYTFLYLTWLSKTYTAPKFDVHDATTLLLRLRDEMSKLCQQNNIVFVHVLFSSLKSLQTQDLHWKVPLLQVSDEKPIHLVDLDPAFLEQPDVHTLFLEGNVHWNSRGSFIVGQVLMDKIGELVKVMAKSNHPAG